MSNSLNSKQVCRYQKCGKLFDPSARQRKYCSVQCRRHAEYDRNLPRKLERNRQWRRDHPDAQRRHQDRQHARDRQFLYVIKPQGLTMVQIKTLEQVLTQLAQQWANRRTMPVSSNLRDRVTFQL